MTDFLKLKKSNCNNCYKCIRYCPVKSIRFSGGQANIVNDECILCGECFVACPQNAKEISDSTELCDVLIKSGAPVIASIAPSFIVNFKDVGIDSIKKSLLELGFADVEETAIGATIVKNEYIRILNDEQRDIMISSCCHSINLLIQKYFPNLLPFLADVVSPMQAHALDIKKRNPEAKVVFIGPCVAKKDEALHYDGIVDAVLTFEELDRMLAKENIVLEHKIDENENSRARFFPVTGGILKSMTGKPLDYTYLAIDGTAKCIEALKDIEKGNLKKCFIEMSACVGSCSGGPVIAKEHSSPISNYMTIANYAGREDFPVASLPKAEMVKYLEPIDRRLSMPSEHEILMILRQLGKTSQADELNCGSCGYNTCREKAIAVIQGKADLTMCMPFLMKKSESVSDNIIAHAQNAIIVLNEGFEIQKVNPAAMTLLNIRNQSDILGEQVIRILDPIDFMSVKNTGREIFNKRAYLTEYNKYVDETITFDKNYKTFICIMRDVTAEEDEKNKKEIMAKKTIETTDKVIEKQMRVVQEIASLLGETTAETKIALTKLKESIGNA